MSQLHVINHPMIQHKLTILRAGLGMVEGLQTLVPVAKVGHIDDHLNENAYIVPGLGDAGDRIFGTK